MDFKVEQRLPTVLEYNHLRNLVEWPTFDAMVVEKAFANTFFSVCILLPDNSIVAMGRIIGDDAIYLHIQDVIVHPDYQGQGAGRMLMDELMNYINDTASANTMVGLMCSKGREKFYKEFGFIERPNERFGSGMVQIMH